MRKKISILVSGPLPPPLGGMETYCKDYLHTKIAEKFKILFCRCILIKQMVEAKGGWGFLLRCINRLLSLVVWVFMLVVKRPDIVHVHTNSGAGFYARGLMTLWAEKFGAKAILHMHGGGFKKFYNAMEPEKKERTKFYLNANSYLVVLSKEWKDFFLSIGIEANKIVIMTNSVFVPEISDKRETKGKLTVLYLSRIEKGKGVFELIDAVESNSGLKEKFRFVIAGPKTDSYEEINQRVKSSGLSNCILMPGPLVGAEKRDAYSNADIYLLQSFAEGMPIGLLEAMSFGLACISTPVGGIPDVIRDRQNGLLIEPGNSKALADALHLLADDSDLRNVLGKQARKTIEEKYNWESRASELSELYLNLLDKRV
jgi:glycosyltransferase involved in cell wall biosynthesis